MLESYHPDSIRYFLTINAPENRDTDFSWREFVTRHNSELLGAYGNFVNRTLKFLDKAFNRSVPAGEIDSSIKDDIQKLYETVGTFIEKTSFKQALESIFAFIRRANKYFDVKQPWIQIKESPKEGNDTLATCVYIIVNVAQLLTPFLPTSSEEVFQIFSIDKVTWEPIVHYSKELATIPLLFERIDVEQIQAEIEKLENNVFV